MDERINYYLLLELDPSIDDPGAIERAIQEKKRRWANESNQGHIAARRKAKLYLGQIADIQRVMSDPDTRAAAAVEARRLLLEQRRDRLRDLDSRIAMFRAGGKVTSEAVARLVKELGGSLPEAEILDRLRAAGLSPDQEPPTAASAAAAKPRLDASRMDAMRPELQVLHHANLYEFLNMSPRSSPRTLRDRADEINREILNIGRTDPESNARKALCGQCLALFSSDDEKQRYDNTLAFETMESLRPHIEIAGEDGFITTDEQDELVKQARARGVEAEDARAYLEQVAKQRKPPWRIQPVAKLPSEELPQCGFCGTLAKSASTKRCEECGEVLVLTCPRCAAEMPTSRAACGECGCRIGDAPVVKSLLRDGERCAATGDITGALAAIDRALVYWPAWAAAVALRKEVVTRRDAREAQLREVDGFVRARKLIEARAALERTRRSYGERGSEDTGRQIAEEIARAEALQREGDKLRAAGHGEEAMERYEQALEACADLASAQIALAATPPNAPTSLSLVPLQRGFHLTWRSGEAPGPRRRHRFLIVRKSGSRPQHQGDGTRIAEVTAEQFDDLGVEAGAPYCWAVFSARGEVVSRTSAAVGPHLLAADVSDAQVLAGDGEVALRWARPPGSARIEVWRNTGDPPARRGEGERVSAGADGLQDSGRRNGQCYGYLVLAVYPDPAKPGAELFAPGVHLVATPAPPPPPLLDLRAGRDGSRIVLTWTPPPGASVQIRRGSRVPESPPGALLPITAAERFGQLVDIPSPGSAELRSETQGQIVFTPLTVAGATMVVGQPAIITMVDDVTDLRAHTNGREIVLTWRWPPGTDEVLVAYTHDHHPISPRELGANCARVTRAGYQRTNGWELRAAKTARHFFTVFVKASSGDLHSPGARILETMGQTTTVRYCVGLKKGGLLGRSLQAAWVDLECSDGIPALPALLVLGKSGQQPLSPTDGVLLAEVPELRFTEGRARIDLPTERAGKSTYVKVFFKDGKHAREIRLLPAANEELRLG